MKHITLALSLVVGFGVALGYGCGGVEDSPDVTGSIVDRFLTRDGQESVPRDLTVDFDVEALVEDEGGQIVGIPAIGQADGTFVIAEVPPGQYVLRNDTSFTVTDLRVIELGDVEFRRPDATPTTGPALVELNIDGLTPFAVGQGIELIGADTFGWYPLAPDEVPADGVTTLAGTVDYGTGVFDLFAEAFLVDGTRGDRFFITQLVDRVSPEGAPYRSIDRFFEPAPVTMTEGGTAAISGSFEPTPQTETAELDLDVAALAALQEQMLPPGSDVLFTGQSFTAFAEFGFDSDAFGSFATLFDFSLDGAIDGPMTVDFANPFDGTQATGSLLVFAFREYEGPAGPATVSVFSARSDTLDAFASGPLTPTLDPVRAPRVDGADAQVPQTGVSTTPVVSWDAPASGAPTHYQVRIREIDASAVAVASVQTADTSVQIPAGVLEPDKSYVFEIRAIEARSDAFFGDGGPRHISQLAGTLTELITTAPAN